MNFSIFLAAVLTVIMGTLDAVFTLEHIRLEVATELNPIMNWVLHRFGEGIFAWTRILVTAVGVCSIAALYNHSQVAKYGFWGIVVVHIVIMVLHVRIIVKLW